jgi:hypothetical protein
MSIPLIQALASFQDACYYLKYNSHLAPNAASAKQRIAKAIGLAGGVSYAVYGAVLANVLADNGKAEVVKRTLDRYNLRIRTKGDVIELYFKK